MVTRSRTVHGVSVPSFFYGTAWKEERTRALTRAALDAGFCAIDTANQRRHYFEAAVGEAIADSGRARAELFLQTKFTHLDGQDHRLPYDRAAPPAEQVAQSFASSLEHLHTEYIDAYILHGPSARDGLPDEDWQVWGAMSELARAKKVRLLGISNVTLPQLAQLHEHAEVKPAFVQNRCYARTGWDREIRAFCRAHDIVYQGFSLLTANRRELAGPTVARITARTRRTVAQVVFGFALQVGMIPLTGTSDASHMREDLQSFDFTLDDADVAAIETIA
jgi:diketogulonate reductase-like aldo/keto reductase